MLRGWDSSPTPAAQRLGDGASVSSCGKGSNTVPPTQTLSVTLTVRPWSHIVVRSEFLPPQRPRSLPALQRPGARGLEQPQSWQLWGVGRLCRPTQQPFPLPSRDPRSHLSTLHPQDPGRLPPPPPSQGQVQGGAPGALSCRLGLGPLSVRAPSTLEPPEGAAFTSQPPPPWPWRPGCPLTEPGPPPPDLGDAVPPLTLPRAGPAPPQEPSK